MRIGLPGSSLPLLPTETGDSIEYSSERTDERGVFCFEITIDGDNAKVELIELCGCCEVDGPPEVGLSTDGVSTLVFTIVCCKSVSIENDDDGGARVRLLLLIVVFVLLVLLLSISLLLEDSSPADFVVVGAFAVWLLT